MIITLATPGSPKVYDHKGVHIAGVVRYDTETHTADVIITGTISDKKAKGVKYAVTRSDTGGEVIARVRIPGSYATLKGARIA